MTDTASGIMPLDLDRMWTREAGNWSYPDDLKQIMAPYDARGQLGNTVGDMGAGDDPISFSLAAPQRLLLFDVSEVILPLGKEGKEVIKIHINLEDLIRDRNLGMAQQYAPLDTFVDSNILNYLDSWKELLSLQAAVHRSGGYLFTATLIGQRVPPYLLAQNRPRAHGEIIDVLSANGYNIEQQGNKDGLSVIVAKRI